jgi:hypothetical protein
MALPKRFVQQNLDAGRIHSARADKRSPGSPQNIFILRALGRIEGEFKQKLLELRG